MIRSVWSTILHLRIPFSFFLMPVFLFALGISPNLNAERVIWVFVILHVFLYPASNAYNSYFDKDEDSIGLLKKPPKVTTALYYVSLLFDFIAITLAWLISMDFAIAVFVYGLASKAYSHPGIRLKRYPWIGWLVAGFFQGIFTFYMAYLGINQFPYEIGLRTEILIPGLLTSLFLWGSYPMTQIYQHKEDKERGDNTLSLLLGIKGTFLFTLIFFSIASAAFFFYFFSNYSQQMAFSYVLFLAPIVVFFSYWMFISLKNEEKANYAFTMWLNLLSAVCLNAFFIYFFLKVSHLGQLNL